MAIVNAGKDIPNIDNDIGRLFNMLFFYYKDFDFTVMLQFIKCALMFSFFFTSEYANYFLPYFYLLYKAQS